MIKQIVVLSKSNAKNFTSDEVWAAISISTYKNDWPKLNSSKRLGLLQLAFADAEFVGGIPKDTVLFDDETAKTILDFVKEMESKDVETILVHCEAGLSRSPAVAAVLAETYLDGEHSNFYFTKYIPNRLVYRKLLDVARNRGEVESGFDFKPTEATEFPNHIDLD